MPAHFFPPVPCCRNLLFGGVASRSRLVSCTGGADSGGGGFKRYFEEISTVLKRHFPDVLINREIVEVSELKLYQVRSRIVQY